MTPEDQVRDLLRSCPNTMAVLLLVHAMNKVVEVLLKVGEEYESDSSTAAVNQDHAAQLED